MYVARVLFIYLLICFWFPPSLPLGFQETCWFALINQQWATGGQHWLLIPLIFPCFKFIAYCLDQLQCFSSQIVT